MGLPQFFPLTVAQSKRGEGPSRTLNKEVALLLVDRRASRSFLAYLQLTAIPLRNPSHHSMARRLSPHSACVKALLLALALLLHLCWGPGPGRFAPVASAGILLGKSNFFICRRRRGVSSRPLHEKSAPHDAGANRPGSQALAKPWEETGDGQGIDGS